jgi:hypothetical protein
MKIFKRGSKRAICIAMLLRPEGATRAQLLAATGWPTISVQDVVSRTGMILILDRRIDRRITYRLKAKTANKGVTMPVRWTVHKDELKRFSVPLRSMTGQGDAECVVFASGVKQAGPAAIEKMKDKWLRHQNKRTRWHVIGKIEEC